MSVAATLAPPAPAPAQDALRVMIVDDAVVVRGLVSRWVNEEPDLKIVVLRTGDVDNVLRTKPDVMVLDIDMPEMDGLAALPLLLARKPNLVVIMSSTHVEMRK
jgi:two-component system chemotaxis response regulator CheB